MTVVKFSVLTLLAGGFCTLLGIGIWMGPQETACNAQTAGVTTVDVAAPCQGCPSATTHAVAATACDTKAPACSGEACAVAGCASEACDLVSAPVPLNDGPCAAGCPTSQVAGPQLPAANPYTVSNCESGVCVATAAPSPTALPSLSGPVCVPGALCAPAPYPTWGPAPVQPPAPCISVNEAAVAYPHQYGVAPAFVAAVPAPVGPPSYADASSNGPTHQELIEAIFEEREARYEAQIEALQAQMQLQLEAGEAIFKAQHEAELIKIKAEAAIEIADLKRSMREQEGLLRHVAAGTISQEALQAIVANCDANAAGETLPVSTDAACKCEKGCCETCKCGTTETPVSVEPKCHGGVCPACEQTISIKTTCTEGECKACPTACATGAKSCESCAACTKECDACALMANTLELVGVDCDGKNCSIVVDGVPVAILNDGCTLEAEGLELVTQSQDGCCKFVFGRNGALCTTGECAACPAAECKGAECKAGECPAGERQGCPAAQGEFIFENKEAPAAKCKNCIEAEVKVTADLPFLSKIPYINKLFKNQAVSSVHYTTDDVQYFPPDAEFEASREAAQQEAQQE